ncbi:hypothetical protein BCF44_14219 [Kutzneria buriramensis]|uniref:DUF397 domain-containing protein n=1 Tax=Kutzneria buriramensis TaxID=1045776 RepID=A0A3E0G7E8_9PSEU|nr:hypothetical protein BCF44_14219 [Kutzneria buriramensis]
MPRPNKTYDIRCRDVVDRPRTITVVRLPGGRVGFRLPPGEWAELDAADVVEFVTAVGDAAMPIP